MFWDEFIIATLDWCPTELENGNYIVVTRGFTFINN